MNESSKASKTVFSEEHKDNIAKALKGKPKSEEHRLRISMGLKRRWAKIKTKNWSN